MYTAGISICTGNPIIQAKLAERVKRQCEAIISPISLIRCMLSVQMGRAQGIEQQTTWGMSGKINECVKESEMFFFSLHQVNGNLVIANN